MTTSADAPAGGDGVLRSLIYVPASIIRAEDTGDDNNNNAAAPSDGVAAAAATATTAAVADLRVLDQLLLPDQMVYVPVPDIYAAWQVIHRMQIRGAPLIAIVAVLGLAVDLQSPATANELEQIERMNTVEYSAGAILAYIQGKMDYIATSRPTAVNLFNALQEVKEALMNAATATTSVPTTTTTKLESSSSSSSSSVGTPRERMVAAVVKHAEFMLQRDEADCRAIGVHGAAAILSHISSSSSSSSSSDGVTMMTICNTGSLATAAYGTALGVVRAVHSAGRLHKVVSLETRPYNQGSRLTCFECLQDGLPGATLICDSMAAAYMRLHHTNINSNEKNENGNLACVVGADRVAANGDTANKIGTYQLAVTAAAHHVPFYVTAPFTTLDVDTESGDQIPIEERPAAELLSTSHAPADMPVWNPAFDVTPAKFITGIITEKGVIRPDANGVIDVKAFVAKHRGGDVAGVEVVATEATTSATQTTLVVPSKSDNNGYTEQTVSSLPLYIATNVPKVMEVLGATTADDLGCFEMGDGNLNLVFIVSNKKTNDDGTVRKVIVKQALPYVRCVGESWPLTLDRAYFEYTALEAEKKACPEFVPDLYHFCKQDALIVMQYLAPPIQILRKGLIQGIRYSTMAADMGIFCAKTLFRTSGFCLSTTELRARVEFWSRNSEMCALTEQVVFTEPYIAADNNRWTSPQLDADKKAIEADAALKSAAAAWKIKFVTQTETLIHADLHTGSVMCGEAQDQHQTYVIDPEFAFYGPAAFDTGAFVANLFLSYVSQEGHRGGDDYADWVLDQISTFWTTFETQFIALWNDPTEHTGFVHGRAVSAGVDNNNFQACQDAYMTTLLADTLGFAGMKMLRRIVGIAHVEDLESIEDADVRAKCERRGLAIAQAFIQSSASFKTIEDAIQFARDTKAPSSSASAM